MDPLEVHVPRSCFVGANSKTTHYVPGAIFFRLNIVEGAAKSHYVPLRLNTLRGMKTAFVSPKKYDKHPPPFLGKWLLVPLGALYLDLIYTKLHVARVGNGSILLEAENIIYDKSLASYDANLH